MNKLLHGTLFSTTFPFGRLIASINLLFFISFCISCVTSKNLRYFTNLNDSQIVKLPALQRSPSIIMPDDILDIKIAGANEETAKLLNTYSSTGNASNTSSAGLGYLVDRNGEIEFPIM